LPGETGAVTLGDAHTHMRKVLADRGPRDLWAVIRWTEVGEPDFWRDAVTAGGEGVAGGSVADMTVLPEDATLQEVWVWPGLKHLHIVIGLKDQQVIVPEVPLHVTWDVPKIGGDGDSSGMPCDLETDRLNRVMGDSKGQHVDIAQLEMLTCFQWTGVLGVS
jgi:hypothetical protein